MRNVEPTQATNDIPSVIKAPRYRKRTLEIGNTLKRKWKGYPNEPRYQWAIVRDVIQSQPAEDTSVYVAVLCEGVEEHAGRWYIWRTYFTNNRRGKLHYGQYGPQAPLAVDRSLHEEILRRGWYDKASPR